MDKKSALAVAAQLDSCRPELLRLLEDRLLGKRGFAANRELRLGYLAQADSVICDCIRSIQSGRVAVELDSARPATRISEMLANRRVSLVESEWAAGELIGITFDKVLQATDSRQQSSQLLTLALSALLRSVIVRHECLSKTSVLAWSGTPSQRTFEYRRRVARELHDGIGTNISLAMRQLDLLGIDSPRRLPENEMRVACARSALRQSLMCVQRLLSGMPPETAIGGFSHALHGLAGELNAGDIEINCEIDGDEKFIPDHLQGEIVVIIKEALWNALIHAAARSVTLNVTIDATKVHATVIDDGVGFDSELVCAHKRSNGLSSMAERANIAGGHVSIASRPGYGTIIDMEIPLQDQEDADG